MLTYCLVCQLRKRIQPPISLQARTLKQYRCDIVAYCCTPPYCNEMLQHCYNIATIYPPISATTCHIAPKVLITLHLLAHSRHTVVTNTLKSSKLKSSKREHSRNILAQKHVFLSVECFFGGYVVAAKPWLFETVRTFGRCWRSCTAAVP